MAKYFNAQAHNRNLVLLPVWIRFARFSRHRLQANRPPAAGALYPVMGRRSVRI